MADDASLIDQFMAITGCDDKSIAVAFVDGANGDLQDALSAFYDRGSTQPTATTTAKNVPSGNNSRVKTFADMMNQDDDDESDDEDQKMYAGGERSGIAVKGPSKKSKGDAQDLVKGILEQAAKGSHEPHDEPAAPKVSYFTGKGQRLGAASSDSQSEPEPVSSSSSTNPSLPAAPETATRLLTFWADGFSVEDGPLLKYDDPQNQEFLNAIKSG